MGELLIGRPALVIAFAAPVALDVGLALSLIYRARLARPGYEAFDRWVEETAARLAPDFVAELRLLLGFSGRRLYFAEELMIAAASHDSREGAEFAPVLDRLAALDAEEYRQMAVRAVEQVYTDAHEAFERPDLPGESPGDVATRASWARFVAPALTSAAAEEAIALLLAPEELRRRTLALLTRFWEDYYAAECAAQAPVREAAVARGRAAGFRDLPRAFAEMTGMRLPDELSGRQSLNRIARVIFCPTAHLARYLSYVAYPPELIVFFDARRSVDAAPAAGGPSVAAPPAGLAPAVGDEALIRALRALGDETRLRIVRMLAEEELYAQEIVGRLGTISQSAVSRHLGVLEEAGVIGVRPARGVKYYALDRAWLGALGLRLAELGADTGVVAGRRVGG